MLGSLMITFGLIVMMIEYIWMFLLGRVFCAFGMGFFFPAASRYIEECSPPHLLTLFYSLYSFGICLARPLLSLTSLILPKDHRDTDPFRWRMFIGVPLIFSITFIIGMLVIIRSETPTYLVS